MDKPRLWTKDFLIVASLNFFVAINFYLLMVTVSGYAMENFHSSPGEAGLSVGIFVIGALISRLICGKWIERVGRRRMLYAGLVLSLVMTVSYLAANGVLFLLVVRFLHGLAFGIAATTAGTIVADIVPKQRLGEGLGYFMLSVTLATAIGPFLAMFMIQHSSFTIIFIVASISAALSLASALFLSVPEIELTEEQLKATKGFGFRSFLEFKAILISIFCGTIYFCYSSVISFITPYSKEIHLMEAASLFFVVYAIAVLISRPYTGRLFDSRGENATMYPAILVFVAGMILFGQARHGYVLLVAAALLGFGSGAIQSVSQAISVKVAPRHRIGLATATFFLFLDAGAGVGPFVCGLFVPVAGYRGVYAGGAVVSFACLFLYYLFHGRRAALARTHPG
jgi:MFS family permease